MWRPLRGHASTMRKDYRLWHVSLVSTFRATSADVVHGFLVQGTNINTMLVPGYVSVQKATFDAPGEHLMPCQEFCSVGHEGMWGKVQVVTKEQFLSQMGDKRRLSCAP